MHTIYKWFVGLYHENLYNFLAGFDCDLLHNQTNQFNGVIGIITVAVVLLIACLYYFIRHARFNRFFSWLIVLGVVALFAWGYGFGIVNSQKNEMPNYVIYGIDQCVPEYDAEDVIMDSGCNSLQPKPSATPVLTQQSFIGFGFANMFIGMIWFILFSFILKRFSQNCRHTPWPSLWPKH